MRVVVSRDLVDGMYAKVVYHECLYKRYRRKAAPLIRAYSLSDLEYPR